MVPYKTCELELSSVVHVIVAEVDVMPLDATAVITGAGVVATPVVVKLKSGELVVWPEAFVETTE